MASLSALSTPVRTTSPAIIGDAPPHHPTIIARTRFYPCPAHSMRPRAVAAGLQAELADEGGRAVLLVTETDWSGERYTTATPIEIQAASVLLLDLEVMPAEAAYLRLQAIADSAQALG
ncbi:hypothetical protein [Nitrospirillum pindoramense]|uniref:Uncharacterized protein n=1 Tax=Nitrospirillum amazonense TaxID=28077 RepID=A0A560HH88_9PROT|nr:hypothetical protein [Nitrospirillum amazonense]TWB45827.1 hypothetical protein FBZ90_101162 [Nitrospirillum amazonense]